jgi:hypothetical protein
MFHSAAWADYRRFRDGATPLFLEWWSDRTGDEPLAMALGFESPDRSTLRGRLARRLEFDSPPASLIVGADLLSPLTKWARKSPALVELRCGSFDARSAWTPGALRDLTWRYEFLVQCTDGVALLAGMRKGARSSIRKAQRIGVEVTACDEPNALPRFSALHAQTIRRLREVKGLNVAVPDQERTSEQLAVLLTHNAGRMYFAHHDGETLAGCFFGLFARSAYYLLNGAVSHATSLGATGLTLFIAMDDLVSQGYTRINLGGTAGDAAEHGSADRGLYSFKKGLGGQPVHVAGGRRPLRPLRSHLASGVVRAMARRR